MIYGIVHWNMNWFRKKQLPSLNPIYTQIYDNEQVWSVKLSFADSPINDGYEAIVAVSFLVNWAPHEKLKKGFIFNIYDGKHIIGYCEII